MNHALTSDNAEILLRRSKLAFSNRDLWRGLLSQAYEFGLPMRNIWDSQTQGTNKMDRVFDSTLIISLQRFAARLQSELTPIGQRWVDFEAGPGVDPDIKDQVTNIIQDANKLFFSALGSSNFDTSVAEFYMELGVGTAAMLFLEGDDDTLFNFEAVPMAQIGIDSGPFGSVDGVFREHSLEVRNIKGTWKDAKLGKELEEKLSKHPEDQISLVECTYFDPDSERYLYKVIWKKRMNSDKLSETLVEREYEEHPWIIGRWVKVPGETMGRGPALFALPDVKTLNKVKEYVLKNAALAIAGVWSSVSDGTFNAANIRIRPGAIINVNRQGDLARVESNARFDVAQILIKDLQQDIRNTMFDRALPDPAGAVRSPTEIIERVKQLQQDIGSPFGRINVEVLQKVVQRGLNIMARRGIIKFPIKINGRDIAMKVNSPIARAQALNDIETIVRWAEVSQGVAGAEAFALSAKVEDLTNVIGEMLGVPVDLIRTEDERKEALKLAASAAPALEANAGGAGGGIQTGSPRNSIPLAA